MGLSEYNHKSSVFLSILLHFCPLPGKLPHSETCTTQQATGRRYFQDKWIRPRTRIDCVRRRIVRQSRASAKQAGIRKDNKGEADSDEIDSNHSTRAADTSANHNPARGGMPHATAANKKKEKKGRDTVLNDHYIHFWMAQLDEETWGLVEELEMMRLVQSARTVTGGHLPESGLNISRWRDINGLCEADVKKVLRKTITRDGNLKFLTSEAKRLKVKAWIKMACVNASSKESWAELKEEYGADMDRLDNNSFKV
eukprot:Colp12_sorted_trinity150504_noHs@23000